MKDCGCKSESTGVVVSFALVKAREPNLPRVIKNLVNQSKKPDLIHVYISKEPFYLDKGFDKKPNLICPRMRIHLVENNGALRKFIPVLKKYWDKPNQKIILTDDDHIWHKDTIKNLLKWSDKLDGVISTAGNFYKDKNPDNWRKQWFHGDTIKKPTRCDVISTGYCCLIRPKYFTEEIFEWEKYKDLGVPYDDEFWFNYMLAKNNIKRWVIPVPKQRDKLSKYGVDMFKTQQSRQTKAKITKHYKSIIMKTGRV